MGEFRHAATVIAIAFVAMLIGPSLLDTYTLTVLIIYGLLALSLGLIWGFGGILCFGQAAFFGLLANALQRTLFGLVEQGRQRLRLTFARLLRPTVLAEH